MVDMDQGMGRYDPAKTQAAKDSPDLAARSAYTEAQQAGQDGFAAARQAWAKTIAGVAARLEQSKFQPQDPSEVNLAQTAQALVQKGMSANAAVATAHEFLAQQAKQAQASQGQPPPGGAPPPGGPPPMQPPPMMGGR